MKELSIEEKAKRYDEAIERAKKLMAKGYDVLMPELFPELKESEDEKIRKAILNYMTIMWGNSQDDVCGVHVEDAIAWLEKQGEQKSIWNEEDEKIVKELTDFCIKCSQGSTVVNSQNDFTRWSTWLKSIKPQNNWKPSEEQIEALEHFVRSIGESGYASPYENNTKLLYSLLEQIKKLREE